jgi:hypothetical protein
MRAEPSTSPRARSSDSPLSGLRPPSLLFTLAALAAASVACDGREADFDSSRLVGNAVCLECHQDRSTYLATAHHLTSALASDSSVRGDFQGEQALLATSNPYLHYRMESTDAGMIQTAIVGAEGGDATRSERIDIVIGSGRKGQTYLSWRDGERLFQLPVSYWSELDRWVNSPGYRDGIMNFDRPVTPRCLECHAGYFEALPAPEVMNRFDSATFTLGVSCERCHGPGEEHADRKRSPIRRYFGGAIVNPAELSRVRQIEVCAQCHGGIGEAVAPAFTYLPGEPLEQHLRILPPDPMEAIDVHGNQVALLARSPCFQGSSMTCSTCHDPHLTQRDPAAFAAKCLSCHQPQQCGIFPEQGHAIDDRCTQCHMPELRSNTIISSFEQRSIQPLVRTHWIRVYPRDGADLRE